MTIPVNFQLLWEKLEVGFREKIFLFDKIIGVKMKFRIIMKKYAVNSAILYGPYSFPQKRFYGLSSS